MKYFNCIVRSSRYVSNSITKYVRNYNLVLGQWLVSRACVRLIFFTAGKRLAGRLVCSFYNKLYTCQERYNIFLYYNKQYRVFLPVQSRFISLLENYWCNVNQLWNLIARSYGTVIFKISALYIKFVHFCARSKLDLYFVYI